MNEDAKMLLSVLALLPVKQQVAISVAILNSVAIAQIDNPQITNHGFKVHDDPIANITGFLAAMQSACGPIDQVGVFRV